MEFVRLLCSDQSWDNLQQDWEGQCVAVGDEFESYAPASLSAVKSFATTEDANQWAIGLFDGQRFLAVALAICTRQKPFDGKVLRIREVTACPLLDYGHLGEDVYINTLIHMLNEAIKLSESGLQAKHIKMHLRSPSDRMFFSAIGNTLDSKGVFASTEAHGAWLTFTKQSGPLKAVG